MCDNALVCKITICTHLKFTFVTEYLITPKDDEVSKIWVSKKENN